MTITIEPMINLGKREVKLLSDDWTVVTRDTEVCLLNGNIQYLVTDDGYEVLTIRPDEEY